MPLIRFLSDPALLWEASHALAGNQEDLARTLGVSRRSITRWYSKESAPSDEHWVTLIRLVHPKNAPLAARIAKALGTNLVALGVEAPPAPPPPPPAPPPPRPPPPLRDLVDSIVCAAAEAASTTPQAMRPALVAAFDRAASVGLGVDDVRAGLRAASGDGGKKAKGG